MAERQKSIWKRDANEVIDPLALAYLRWLRHWWAHAIMLGVALLGIALVVIALR